MEYFLCTGPRDIEGQAGRPDLKKSVSEEGHFRLDGL